MNDVELRGEFRAVRDSIDALTQGLTLLAEGQRLSISLSERRKSVYNAG